MMQYCVFLLIFLAILVRSTIVLGLFLYGVYVQCRICDFQITPLKTSTCSQPMREAMI